MKILQSIYYHPWCPRFFFKKYDGGKESGVTGYFLLEHKKSFSIGLLHFRNGSRENYHSHSFNAISWFLSGSVTEEYLSGETKSFAPSFWPKFTPRIRFHRVVSHGDTWCLTLRGPWRDTWMEFRPSTGEMILLTHGRKELKRG